MASIWLNTLTPVWPGVPPRSIWAPTTTAVTLPPIANITRAKRPSRAPVEVLDSLPREEGIQGPPYRRVIDHRATLLGLPAEIRLLIWAYLSEDKIIHVYCSDSKGFTWIPCEGVNAEHPSLCANPEWSGLCHEEDRCTYKDTATHELRGFWAVAATSQQLRQETQEFTFTNTAFSIVFEHLASWIGWLQKDVTWMLKLISKITLTTHDENFDFTHYYGATKSLPNLRSIGLQCQTIRRDWVTDLSNPTINVNQDWLFWRRVNEMRWFERDVSIIVEGWVWLKSQKFLNAAGEKDYVKEHQGIIRVIRDGKAVYAENEHGWEDDDMRIEVLQLKHLLEKDKKAGWRASWRKYVVLLQYG